MYNTLFGAQSPDGRHIRYYTALEGKRVYFPPDNFLLPRQFPPHHRRIADQGLLPLGAGIGR